MHGNGKGPCLSGHTVERARSMSQEQALVCPVSTSTSLLGADVNQPAGNTVLRSARVLVEAANPFTFWVQATRFMWMPWLLTAQTMMLPAGRPRTLPSAVHPPSARGADGLGDPFFTEISDDTSGIGCIPSSRIDPGKNLRPYLFMRPASDQNSEVLKAHTNFSRIFDDPHVRGRHCINERFD